MDLGELRAYLDRLVSSLDLSECEILKARLQGLVSVFPFSEYEYILMFLRDRDVISFQDYERLRDNYVSANRYLDLFSLAPRVFGQIWGEEHIRDLDPRFQKPDKSLDPEYGGEYDLWIEGVKVEVKSSRAMNTEKQGSLVSKALRSGSDEPFWMNYQQLKPDLCDVFVFVSVWVDAIAYWVLSSRDVRLNRHLSHQHRGGIEYQIGITHKNIHEFEPFRTSADQIGNTVLRLGRAMQSHVGSS